jgi:hypothetical protein
METRKEEEGGGDYRREEYGDLRRGGRWRGLQEGRRMETRR